jgi:hypothetical protein
MKAYLLSAIVLVAVSCGTIKAQSNTNNTGKSNHYFIQVSGPQEQCKKMMTEMQDKGDKFSSKFEIGCATGDHSLYGFVEAPTEAAARKMLPLDLQQKATVVQVEKFSGGMMRKK